MCLQHGSRQLYHRAPSQSLSSGPACHACLQACANAIQLICVHPTWPWLALSLKADLARSRTSCIRPEHIPAEQAMHQEAAPAQLHADMLADGQHTAGMAADTADPMSVQVALHVVLPFLEGSVRAAGEKQRTAAVVHSLQRAENLRTREELALSRQRYTRSSLRACTALLAGASRQMSGGRVHCAGTTR